MDWDRPDGEIRGAWKKARKASRIRFVMEWPDGRRWGRQREKET